jgi:hypothetical protein
MPGCGEQKMQGKNHCNCNNIAAKCMAHFFILKLRIADLQNAFFFGNVSVENEIVFLKWS